MKEITFFISKITAVSRQVSPALLPDVSASYCQRTLVDESGMIKTLTGDTTVQKWSQCLGRLVRHYPVTVTVSVLHLHTALI
jgi:hypothetical protein